MFLVSACSCLCAIYWSQALGAGWRCSWSSADRRINNSIAIKVRLILETWRYLFFHRPVVQELLLENVPNIFISSVMKTYAKLINSRYNSRYITLTSKWPRWRLKSPASWLFTQPFIQMQIKENIKAPRHWPLCGEFTGTGEFPAQRASYAENVSIWWRHHGFMWLSWNKNIDCVHGNQM